MGEGREIESNAVRQSEIWTKGRKGWIWQGGFYCCGTRKMKAACYARHAGLASEFWFPDPKPLSEFLLSSWKGLATLWNGQKYGFRNLERWIQVLG